MKKIAYLSVLAGLMMTGCIAGDYGIEAADPQTSEQEEAVVLPNSVEVSPVATIDLAKVEEDQVAVASYTPVAIPEGTEADLSLIVAGKYVFPVAEDMKIAKADLQKIVETEFGKRPTARTLKSQLEVNVLKGGQASLLAVKDFDIQVIPVAPHISSAYYLVGNMNGWNPDEAAKNFKFNHSEKDVYDDPVFTIAFEAGANCYWKILAQEGYDEGDAWKHAFGVAKDGDTALEGKLTNEGNFGAGQIEMEGKYVFSINMMDGTYSITALASEFYLVGTVTGWNGSNDPENQFHMLYPMGNNQFRYTTLWEGDHNFKLWAKKDLGNWDNAYGTAVDGDNSPEGKLVNKGAGAIKTPTADEYYTVIFDMANNTYRSEKLENQNPASYEQISLVGTFTDWGGKPDVDLVQKAPHNWVAKNVKFEAETNEIKFRLNHDWALDWGADANDKLDDQSYGVAKQKGGNFKISAGTYDVYFNDITMDYCFIKK